MFERRLVYLSMIVTGDAGNLSQANAQKACLQSC